MADAITQAATYGAPRRWVEGDGYSIDEIPPADQFSVAPSRWRIDAWEGERHNAMPFVRYRLTEADVARACDAFEARNYPANLIAGLRAEALAFVGTLPGAHPVASIG